MAYNYYVLVTGTRRLEGPLSFKEAMHRKSEYDIFSEMTQILKIVVDESGKEVK